MFKKNKKIIDRSFTKVSKTIVFVLFLSVVFVAPSFSLELTLKGAMDNMKNKFTRNASIKIGGKATIDDIYNVSLDKVQQEQLSPMFSTISKTTQHLNRKYSCQLMESEIVDILYFANSAFKRDLKLNLKDFKAPNKSDMGNACNKFYVCKSKDPTFKNTPTTNQICQSDIEKIFLQLYTNTIQIENLGSLYKDTAYFWNGDLNDSAFDILNDVYILSTILFQDAKKPATIPFFNMPTVNYNAIYNEPELNMVVNWFSPYNTYITTSVDNDGQEGSNSSNNIGDTSLSENVDIIDNSNINQYVDSSIIDFIESTTINVSNPGLSIAGNQCISGFDVDSYKISVTQETVTPAEYLETILEDINNASCNNDGVCQTWEGAGCSDCSASQGTGDFDEIEAFLQNAFPDLNNDNSNVGQSDDDPTPNAPNLGCLQKCEPLPCNALNCDKLVCYAQCLCLEYEPELFNTGVDVGITHTGFENYMDGDRLSFGLLSNAFKIKFCPIPAVGIEPKKSTKVYNIHAILLEIKNVLSNLRNSGEMGLKVKTKEFLDSSNMKRNFAKEISFTVNSSIASSIENKSENTKQDEQLQFSNNLMTSVLGFGKDMTLDIEKNKYVVMDEPCNYIVAMQDFDSSDQKEQAYNSCISDRKTKLQISGDLSTVMVDYQVVLINEEFDKFMKKNSDFWQELKLYLSEMLQLAKSLSEKQ